MLIQPKLNQCTNIVAPDVSFKYEEGIQYSVVDLKPYVNYTFVVYAVNNNGTGHNKSETKETKQDGVCIFNDNEKFIIIVNYICNMYCV